MGSASEKRSESDAEGGGVAVARADEVQAQLAREREEWAAAMQALQAKLDEVQRERDALMAGAGVVDRGAATRSTQAWILAINEEVQAAYDAAYRLDTHIWGIKQLYARTQRERAQIEARLESEGTPPPLSSRLSRLAGTLSATCVMAADELRVLRSDLAGLDRSRAQLREHCYRALSELKRLGDEERANAEARLEAAMSRLGGLDDLSAKLHEDVRVLNDQLLFARTLSRRLRPAVAAAARESTRPEPVSVPIVGIAEESFPPPEPPAPPEDGPEIEEVVELTQRSRELQEDFTQQRLHIAHWEEVTHEMGAAGHQRLAQALAAAEPRENRSFPGPVDEVVLRENRIVFPEPVLEGDVNTPFEILIIDDGQVAAQAARRLRALGYLVTVLKPAVDITQQIGKRRLAGIAVNLAVPDGWGAVRRVRGGYRAAHPQMYAYALAPGATRAFWFGSIDFFFASAGEHNAAQLLRGLAPVVRRVVAVSSDPELMGEFWLHLEEAGIQATLAADAGQLLECLPKVRPQVAVVHLSPRCFDVFRAIGTLQADAARVIPLLFVVDQSAEPRDVAFFSAGVRMLAEEQSHDPGAVENLLCFNLKMNSRRKAPR